MCIYTSLIKNGFVVKEKLQKNKCNFYIKSFSSGNSKSIFYLEINHSYSNTIVTVILYHVPSIHVSVFIQLVTILSQHITLKRITSCLLAYIRDCNFVQCCVLNKVYKP